MSYKLEGTVKVMSDTQTFDSGFSKREIVVTNEDQFPQDIKVEFLKDDADLLKSIKEGDEVIINFSVRGNEYKGKYFVNIVGFSITKKKFSKDAPAPANMILDAPDGVDDLPF